MVGVLNSVLLAYLAGTGGVANASIVTRGLVRSVRKSIEGKYHEAAVEALAAIAAPSILAFATTRATVEDVIDGAFDLLGPALEDTRRMSMNRLHG